MLSATDVPFGGPLEGVDIFGTGALAPMAFLNKQNKLVILSSERRHSKNTVTSRRSLQNKRLKTGHCPRATFHQINSRKHEDPPKLSLIPIGLRAFSNPGRTIKRRRGSLIRWSEIGCGFQSKCRTRREGTHTRWPPPPLFPIAICYGPKRWPVEWEKD